MASRKAYRQTSKRPAAPMPPPMHIVTCARGPMTKEQQARTSENKEESPRKREVADGSKTIAAPSVRSLRRTQAARPTII